MWIRWLSHSDVRMFPWLYVVMPSGLNDSWAVDGGSVYLKRSLPAALTTKSAPARLSSTQMSESCSH